MNVFKHTDRIEKLLREGKRKEAEAAHNRHVDIAFGLAKAGLTINLSDLLAAKEAFHLDDLKTKGGKP